MKAAEEFLQEASGDSEDMLLLLKDALGLVSYYRHLLEHYELDTLTGLSGANKFKDMMAGIGDKAAGMGVIFFDVNDLKYYNDNKGHQAGDLLLQKAAESILVMSGRNTHSFRIGGDEFVVIINQCTESEVEALLLKWREKLAKLNTRDDGIQCNIAAGYAIAGEGDNISDTLKLADERMYTEKKKMKAGREPR